MNETSLFQRVLEGLSPWRKPGNPGPHTLAMQHEDDDFQGGDAPPFQDAIAVEWAARQRFVDGLLRASKTPVDANESSIDSILSRLDEPRAMPLSWSRPQRNPHHISLVLAASLLAGLLLWPLMLPASLPEAHASVQRAAEVLGACVDRRFAIELRESDGDGPISAQALMLTVRPGRKFLVSGPLEMGPLRFSAMQFGCDGKDCWFDGQREGAEPVRREGPLVEAPSLLRGIGNTIDLGFLDMHSFVSKLPETFQLKTIGRSKDQGGNALVHVQATGGPERAGFHLRRAEIVVAEASGMIVRVDIDADDGLGEVQRIRFVDLGTQPVYDTVYQKPW
jgi:hypothetical protein